MRIMPLVGLPRHQSPAKGGSEFRNLFRSFSACREGEGSFRGLIARRFAGSNRLHRTDCHAGCWGEWQPLRLPSAEHSRALPSAVAARSATGRATPCLRPIHGASDTNFPSPLLGAKDQVGSLCVPLDVSRDGIKVFVLSHRERPEAALVKMA
jgi:hypothetical protein